MQIQMMKLSEIHPYEKKNPRFNDNAVRTEVPVMIAENLTPEQVQAYRIADNKTGEIAK